MPKQSLWLARGIPRLSRSASYKKSGKWAVPHRGPLKSAVQKKATTVTKKFGKGTREVPLQKAPRFYPTEDLKTPLRRRKCANPPKVRPSLGVPGTVLILLAGRFRGKRVILLKALPSGLMLITGPYKVNGVPLRRVNPRYVIATGTKVDVSAVNIPEQVKDEFFQKSKKKEKKKKSADEFFNAEKKEKKELPAEVKEIQQAVDEPIIAEVKKVPHMLDYLRSRFSLHQGQFPHLLKF